MRSLSVAHTARARREAICRAGRGLRALFDVELGFGFAPESPWILYAHELEVVGNGGSPSADASSCPRK